MSIRVLTTRRLTTSVMAALVASTIGALPSFALPATGKKAPSLDSPLLIGGQFHLRSALGRGPIILNFFTVW